MSRLAKPKSSTSLRTPVRAPSSPTKTLSVRDGGPSRLRATPARPSAKSPTKQLVEEPVVPPTPRLSMKEQIALKRAEAKKAQSQLLKSEVSTGGLEEDLPVSPVKKPDDDLTEMGRLGIRETINRARSTGNLNLSARSLPCLPSVLFEIHLGVKPQPIPDVTEPEYPEEESRKTRSKRQDPSWFDAQDLVVLKARSNDMVAIQPEISLFGSLKTLDFHHNRLTSLPSTITILTNLTVLDLSENKLTGLPPAIFSLPNLTTVNLRRNELTSLQFSKFGAPIEKPATMLDDGYFEPAVFRSDQPLPKLHTLDISFNKLVAKAIDSDFLPANITHLTLSNNPLGDSSDLVRALSGLEKLQELRIDRAQIGDDSFLASTSPKFPSLRLFDLEETQASESTLRTFFNASPRAKDLSFDVTTSEPRNGELRVIVGKKIVKEKWEIEAEQRYLKKKKSIAAAIGRSHNTLPHNDVHGEAEPIKEPWEVEAEQGLATEGGRRRARAAAATASSVTPATSPVTVQEPVPPLPTIEKAPVIQKEQWEIEAEQGLLTEGGRRRARALQAQQAEAASASTAPASSGLAGSSYYTAHTLTLTLPPSAPPSARLQPRGHMRAFSLADTPQSNGQKSKKAEDLSIPIPTLPLNVITTRSFASTLRVLVLSKRRADPSFVLPTSELLAQAAESGGVLPNLDELYLDGCNLGDSVPVLEASGNDESTNPAKAERQTTIEVLIHLFPSLGTLDLSYNAFTSESLTPQNLMSLLVPSHSDPPRSGRGLKVLRLRGNRLTSLDPFEGVANLFKGNRQLPEWKLEELDVRDNEVSKLPVLLGLLPLDVFLVDGNTFRIPPRKVWEREGTKGLLNWLRGRIE